MAAKKLGRETVTYVVWFAKSVRRITVPAHWKVTLGVELRGGGHVNSLNRMLRFYEGTLQRACLENVRQFCDDTVKAEVAADYEGLQKLTGEAETEPLGF